MSAKLDCRAVRRKASDYIDGRLPPEARLDLQAHLRGCSACVTVFRGLVELSRLAAGTPRAPVPPDLGQRVRAALHRPRSARHERRAPGRRRIAAAAALAVLLLASIAVAALVGYRLGRARGLREVDRLAPVLVAPAPPRLHRRTTPLGPPPEIVVPPPEASDGAERHVPAHDTRRPGR